MQAHTDVDTYRCRHTDADIDAGMCTHTQRCKCTQMQTHTHTYSPSAHFSVLFVGYKVQLYPSIFCNHLEFFL